jgi:hypothetical protein
MSLDIQWDHQFCLACDKQTDGATYCSESCRLADFEKTSSADNSGASSPALSGPSYAWSFSNPTSTTTKFYLSPAFDFSSNTQLSTPSTTTPQRSQQTSMVLPTGLLSPSSSHSSLSSMGSNPPKATEAYQLSDKAKRELQAYASSFEQVRLQRRRSY